MRRRSFPRWLAAGFVLGCAGAAGGPAPTPAARVWVEGPVRWLMAPEEVKDFRTLTTNREVLDFIEAFWQRRDPTPGDDDNPARTAFYERAAAADRLYGEGKRPGSLTDRGRALIVLGPPTILRYRQRAVPAFDPSRHRGRPGAATGQINVEIWGYLPDDLPAALLELLPEDRRGGEITLSFASEGGRSRMLDGEEIVELAVRAALQPPR